MRGGFGARVGRATERYSLRRLDRAALRHLLSKLRPFRSQLIWALLATQAGAAVAAGLPLLLRLGIDRYVALRDLRGLGLVVLAYVVLQGFAWWVAYWRRLLSASVSQRLVAGMRRDLFASLVVQDVGFHSRQKVGELISRLTGDLNAIAEVASSGALGLVADLAGVILAAAVMFALDWRLALVALVMIPVVLLATAYFGRRLRDAYTEVRVKAADMGSNLQETLAGMRIVQSLARESASMERFDQVNVSNLRASMHAMLVFAVFFPLMTITGSVGTAVVLAYGGSLLARGLLSLGTLVAFLAYVRTFFGPLRELSQVQNTFQSAAASLMRYWHLLEQEPVVRPPARPIRPTEVRGEIEFRNVRFGYRRGETVFTDLCLHIPAGRRLALVGPSGAGKTTLVNLLTRLYDVDSGAVLVDGIDVRSWPLQDLRRIISVVPQEAGLLPGTVMDNIIYGRPDATAEEVIDLAKQLGVDDLLAGLPRGYETGIGPGGAGRISGGQRQVIAILRAVLRDPAILVADEATSNVDGRTEALINAGLEKALARRTGMIIAHRLRGVGLADEIVLLDKGTLVGRGTHDELMKSCELYRDLYETQGLVPVPGRMAGDRGRRSR